MAGPLERFAAGHQLLDSPADDVVGAPYNDYAAALNNYQLRSDVEPLADRRARDIGGTFAAADFVRQNMFPGYDLAGNSATVPVAADGGATPTNTDPV
jgi:hypothetical protein